MKTITPFMTIFISICLNVSVYSQNVGIGTSSPLEALDVNGAINIGTNSGPGIEAGTIRWNDETQETLLNQGTLSLQNMNIKHTTGQEIVVNTTSSQITVTGYCNLLR